MPEPVTAEAILRSADGSSILDTEEAITAETIAKYRVEKGVIDEVSRKLEELGFRIEQVGPTSLTLTGDQELFETVFQTTLEGKTTGIMDTQLEGVEASYFDAKEPIQIPENLASLIADVVLPSPPQLFS